MTGMSELLATVSLQHIYIPYTQESELHNSSHNHTDRSKSVSKSKSLFLTVFLFQIKPYVSYDTLADIS